MKRSAWPALLALALLASGCVSHLETLRQAEQGFSRAAEMENRERYGDDLAVLWVDAHPDVMGPAQFQNAHAHVLAMLMGEGDSDFVAAVSRPLNPRRILYLGLTETTSFETLCRRSIERSDAGSHPRASTTYSMPVA